MRQPTIFRRAFDEIAAQPELGRFVLDELRSTNRHWYGLLHHALMLRAVARAVHDAPERRLLILAILFHDIVYDATRSDNEEGSAAVARQWLGRAEADDVAALILATEHHDLAAANSLTRTLLEADLAILWTPSAGLYAFYAAGIRREYAHVPDAAYRAGRTAVLKKLETQLRPYVDPEKARLADNLTGEREGLAAGAFDLS